MATSWINFGQVRCWIRESAIFNNGMLSLQQQNFPSILSSRINKTQWEIGWGYQGNNWVRCKELMQCWLGDEWYKIMYILNYNNMFNWQLNINVFLMQYSIKYRCIQHISYRLHSCKFFHSASSQTFYSFLFILCNFFILFSSN